MKINYCIDQSSKNILFIDVPFRQSMHHFYIAWHRHSYGQSLSETITHIVLGILKFIPVLGHVVALIDTLRNRAAILHLKLVSTDSFQRGKEHGHILKKRIQEMYEPILAERRGNKQIQQYIKQFEMQIPDSLKIEMQGLAAGSGYSYADVLLVHSFLDCTPGVFGCTAMVVKEKDELRERIVAANHSLMLERLFNNASMVLNKDSVCRRRALLNQSISMYDDSASKVLQAAGRITTVQSMVFDTAQGKVHLASRGSYAASGNFTTFEADTLFGAHQFKHVNDNGRVRLFRNLDWPWHFLGQETIVLTRSHANGNSTVSISWPGYIGTLSGMNNTGLALTANQLDSGINLKGIPNPLLFTGILDSCKDVDEASTIIGRNLHGSSMNVVIADKISAKSYELIADKEIPDHLIQLFGSPVKAICVGAIN